MCGIAGYCLKSPERLTRERFDYFMGPIRKRGPDDEGVCLINRSSNTGAQFSTDRTVPSIRSKFIDVNEGAAHDVALLHSRYAILDLSDHGHQPFLSRKGDVTVIFNGEIYNFVELREELMSLGIQFHTHCDTEVLAEGYSRWKDDLWAKLNGFWAVVLYDHTDRSVVFCRDRLGVAPLYYRETGRGIFFSSYLASLVAIDGVPSDINDEAMRGFIQTGFKDIQEETFYKDIKTFPSASYARIPAGGSSLSQIEIKPYWRLPQGRLSTNDLSFDQAVKTFRETFFNAVSIRLRADVKIAFELSGGLDSSSVVAACAQLSKEKITTYTAKVRGADEEPIARMMCRRYDLDYRVIHEKENLFRNDYGSFSDLMEEPYDNPNDYTHYRMLKEMKSQGVQVVITGAGGDEVFAGYESSFWPKAYRQWRAQGGKALWDADCHEFCRRFRNWKNTRTTLTHYLVDPWKRFMAKKKRKASLGQSSTALALAERYGSLNYDEQRRFHFTTALLPYYMRSSDHFTMGIPVEHRFPLLDYRLVEFGLRLPIEYVFKNGWTKYLVRKAMEPFLPPEIAWRREKMGFRFPYRLYFAQERAVFEPLLQGFYRSYPEYGPAGNYEELMREDPLLLWRIISTAVWLNRTKGAAA